MLAATGDYFCYELFMLVNFTNQITKILRRYSDCSGILHVSLWGTIRPNVLLHIHNILRFVVHLLSGVQLFVTPRTAEGQASLSFTIFCSLFKLMFIESVIPSNHLILCQLLLLLPSIFLSIRVFSNESALHIRWLKYWRFNFSISPSAEYSGLISFRIDWFDHLAFQGILKSLLQHHSSKASILQCSAFFTEKATAPHSSTFAWEIPWTEEPGRLQSMGSRRVGHD